ncbi:BatD family protein [Thiolapillus sp.]
MMFHSNNPGDIALIPSVRAGGRSIFHLMVLLLLLLLSGLVQGAQIRVETDRSDIAADDNFQIIFSVEGDAAGEPDFSVLNKDFELLGTSQSRSVSIINGKTSRTTRYLVNVLPRREGELTIPPVSFGNDKSPQVKILVKESGVQGRPSAAGADASVFLEVSVDEETPYVQQQVILTVRIFSSISWREASLSEPEFEGGEVLVQKLGEDSRYQKQRAGKNWQVIERRYALFPQQSGDMRMQALNLHLRIPAGRKKRQSPFGGGFNDPFFDDFFSNQSYRNKVVRGKEITLKVKPAPAGFTGGQWLIARSISLEESWSDDPGKLKAGEPVTRTLAIVADGVTLGQLPDLEIDEIDGLRIYPDEPVAQEQATSVGILSTSSRKFAIIPVRPGDYGIPAIELKWWNSETDKEEVAKIAPRVIKVAGSARVSVPPVPVVPETVAEKPPEKTAPLQVDLPPVVSPVADGNKWLLAGAVLFLVLWLVTLVLFLRLKRSAPFSCREEAEAKLPAADLNTKAAWKALHESVEEGSAAGIREALLMLAPVIWPEQSPRSLEAMAQRVGEPLSGELLNVSRELYAGEKASWDGLRIEQEMKELQKDIRRKAGSKKQEALKPMYPEL